MTPRSTTLVLLTLVALALGACHNTARGVKADTKRAVQKTGHAIEKTGDKIENAPNDSPKK